MGICLGIELMNCLCGDAGCSCCDDGKAIIMFAFLTEFKLILHYFADEVQPDYIHDNPGVSQPDIGMNPNPIWDQPSFGVDQPDIGVGDSPWSGPPSFGVDQPNIGVGGPSFEMQEPPSFGVDQPNIGIGGPNVGVDQPNFGVGAPNVDYNRY